MGWLGATLLAVAALTSPIKAEDAAQGAPESHAAGGGAQEMCLGSLADFLRFLSGAVRTCGHDRSLKFYGTGESGHWAVQANQQIAAALAILSETPDAELAAAGSPYTAAELSDLSLALFRYSLRTHRTGDIPCTDGRKWGKSWISVLGLERASGGIGIIERRMSEEDRRRLRDVLVFECDYRLNEYPIKAGIVENNVPESNLWNAGVMFRTASNYPDLPQAGDYAAKARKMMLNGLTRPSDSNETWYVGANFTDEWALDHHGYLNVGYMYESLSNLAFLHFDFLDRGRPEPAELMHNVAPLWEVCKLLTFPDGRLCRIGGDTRVRHAYCQLFAMQSWALAAHALGDADALVYEREGIRRLRREQVAGTDGSYFGKRLKGLRDASWYYYCRLEADAALAVAYSLHWHRKGYLGESDMEVGVASDGSWYVPLHRATFLRGPKSYRSVCVRSQSGFGNRSQMPNIVCAPADRSDLAEWGANLVGAVGLQMECDEPGGSPERWDGNMFRERRYSDEGGEAFEQAFRIPVKDGVPLGEGETSPASVAERGMKVVAVGDGTTMAIRDTVVMTRTASLEHGYSIGRMVIPNDVLNGGSRRYEGDGTDVVTVDGALSLVSVNGGVARVRRNRPLTFQRPGQSRFMHPVEMHGADVIVLEGSREEPVLAEAGETLYDVVYLAIAGADAESARRVAASAKWDGPSERLVFTGTDGIERKLDMSVDVDAWPAGRDPESVSRRISEQFLSADPVCYAPVGSTVTNAISPGYGWNNHIFYATASMWVTALDNARQFGDAALESRLVGAFEPYLGERAEVLKPIKHVDFNVVGAVPLAIARLTGDERARKVGLSLADFQWREPSADDAVVGKSPMDERVKWWKQGYTDETRLWIDDMYMINLLQTEAYRLSGDAKYIDRAAKEMVLYLDRLQNADGLFYHAPDVPFVWGRGAGWMSGGMALVLKALPAGHPCRERILVGYRKMMARLLACQRDDGLWGQLVDDPASWPETSGSAMFAYGMAEGVANGWLDGGEYRTAVRRAWLSLTSRLDRYGNISGVCVGTNKKNDRQYYLDRPCLNGDPHGQAPMLWLAGAMERCRREVGAAAPVVQHGRNSLRLDYDVCVVGGGAAGIAAAAQAARAGARTVLVELGGQLGGTMTSGGVGFPGLFHAWGRQVIDGVGCEIVTNAVALCNGRLPDFTRPCGERHWVHQIPVEPWALAASAEETLLRAGVEIRYFSAPLAVSVSGDAWALRIVCAGDECSLAARTVIDATGNGTVCAKAGFARMRDEAARQPGSFVYRFDAGCDVASLDRDDLQRRFEEAVKAGVLMRSDCRMHFADFLARGGGEMNYVPDADNSTGASRSALQEKGRASMLRMLRFVRTIPGCERARMVSVASEVGVRETYRVVGETVMSGDDYVSARIWPDGVCHSFYPIDMHDTSNGVMPRQQVKGRVASVPLSALMPRGSCNLMAVGRCVSSDRVANSALRVQASCMSMGQAAGEAAALAAELGCKVADVPIEKLRRRLEASGAIVPPLSPSAGAVPQLLIDTDMLTDCDDVAALELAFECERRGDADVLAITVSSAYPKSAPVVDAVATFCGRGGVPIGTPKNGTGHRRDDSCFLDRVAAEYPHGLESNDDAPDAVDVMRRTLARAEDASVTLVTLGYLSNVASLLKSGPDDISPLAGRDLVGRKVKEWVCMGGNFPNDPAKDNVNFTRDAEAAVFAITNYPGRITFVGREIGHSIFIGDRFHDLPAANPLRRAYELHRGRFGRNWDHHTADPVTILYAVYGQGRRFGRVEGTLSIRPDCSFSWNPANASNMSYLTQAEPRADTARAMEELVIPWTMAGDAPSARRPGALRSGPANSD